MNKKYIDYYKIFWLIMIFNAILVSILCILIFSSYNNLNKEVKIIEIELDNSNYIYDSGDVLGIICEDNVYVSKMTYYFSKIGKDFLYLSTWNDGKIPNSKGKCYLKVKQVISK